MACVPIEVYRVQYPATLLRHQGRINQGHNMAKTSTKSFEFYNHNERLEVLYALTYYQKRLSSEGLDPANCRAEVLNRLIDDFQDFTLDG